MPGTTKPSAVPRLLVVVLLCTATIVAPPAHALSIGCVLSPVRPEMCDIFEVFVNGFGLPVQRVDEVELLDSFDSFDFVLADPKTAACVNVENAAAPINTLGLLSPDTEDTYIYERGGVVFTRADSGIVHFSGIVDSTVAATTTTDFTSVHTVFAEYRKELGRDLVDDAAVIEYLGSPYRVLDAVLSGAADVGLVYSGFLENAVSQGIFRWDDLNVLSQNVVVNNGQRYPYFVSTDVYPDFALFPSLTADNAYKEEITVLLFETNTTTDGKFTAADSYSDVSTILEDFGVIERDLVRTSIGSCLRSASHSVASIAEYSPVNITRDGPYGKRETHPELSLNVRLPQTASATGPQQHPSPAQETNNTDHLIICPESHFLLEKRLLHDQCAGTTCPDNALCMCRPCKKVAPVQIHPAPTYITAEMVEQDHDVVYQALATSCERMDVCGVAVQPEPLYFLLEDKLYDRRPNKDTYFFSVQAALVGGPTYTTEVESFPNAPHLALVNVSGANFGTVIIEVFLANRDTPQETWEPIYASPFLFAVEPRPCPNGEEATQENTCVCKDSGLRVGGQCMAASQYLPLFMCSAVGMILLVVSIAWFVVRKRADTLWRIDIADIVVSDPPEILGQGAFGVVIKGELNGTAVAIKRAVPRAPSHGTGTKSSVMASRRSKGHKSSKNNKDESKVDMTGINGTATVGLGHKFDINHERVIEDALAQDAPEASKSIKSRRARSKEYANAKAEFAEEIRLLSRLRHPCVATMLGAIVTQTKEVLLVMEHLEHGSLYDFLRDDKLPTPDMFLLPIVKDIVSGMRYIHNLKPAVIHGDLKAKNVLVDGNFKAKIADFGLSQKQRFGCGTPFWMAPEVLRGGEVTREADVYSFAITVYEIYSRQDPFPEEDVEDVLRQIATRQMPFKRPELPESCPVMLAEMARRCWAEEPKFRPTFDQVDAQLSELNISKVGASLVQQKQEALKKSTVLNDVFPPHIAKRLEEGKKVSPEHKSDVTIFFSDIVGFTNISSQLTPAAVSDMLDRLYSAFDELVDKHGVFKVETIGDAYMAATNLVEPQHDHALRIGRFAEEAIKAAQSTFIDPEQPDLGCVNIRVGFHSGPVVANVVGKRNPRYCLFGDTVNTASRMESSSERNRIHVSSAAADRLRSQAPWAKLESRGIQNIKGKGEMLTYWLNSTQKSNQDSGGEVADPLQGSVVNTPNTPDTQDQQHHNRGSSRSSGEATSESGLPRDCHTAADTGERMMSYALPGSVGSEKSRSDSGPEGSRSSAGEVLATEDDAFFITPTREQRTQLQVRFSDNTSPSSATRNSGGMMMRKKLPGHVAKDNRVVDLTSALSPRDHDDSELSHMLV